MHWSAYIYILANFPNWNKPEKSFMSIIRNQQLVLRMNIGFHSEETFGLLEDFFKIQEFLIHVSVLVFTMHKKRYLVINFCSDRYLIWDDNTMWLSGGVWALNEN